MEQEDASTTGKAALFVLFMVTMIDMIGFGIIIPFLTYLVKDLAEAQGIVQIGLWVGLLMTSYSAAQFLFSPFWGALSGPNWTSARIDDWTCGEYRFLYGVRFFQHPHVRVWRSFPRRCV